MGKLQVNEEELFAPYLSHDDLRLKFMKPFLSCGYVCATDAYIMLKVKQELLSGEYAENGTDIKKLLEKPNMSVSFSLDELQQAVKDSMTGEEEVVTREVVVCPECNGEGEVEWKYSSEEGRVYYADFECPRCHGTGNLIDAVKEKTGEKCAKYEDVLKIQGVVFRTELIARMCDTMRLLSVDKVEYISRSYTAGNIFKVAGGVEVVIIRSLIDDAKVSLKH